MVVLVEGVDVLLMLLDVVQVGNVVEKWLMCRYAVGIACFLARAALAGACAAASWLYI